MTKERTFHSAKNLEHQVGLVLLVLSFCYYALGDFNGNQALNDPISYLIYAAAMIYGLKALFTKDDLHIKTIGLSLMYVACFLLNSGNGLFQEFTLLQSVWMVVTQITMLCIPMLEGLNKPRQKVLLFFTGLSTVFTIHMAVYLMPAYGFGLIGIILLGIGMLVFVPLLSSIHFIRLLKKQNDVFSKHKKWFWSGFYLPLVVALIFMIGYSSTQQKLNSALEEYTYAQSTLPRSLYLRQNINFSDIDKHFLDANYKIKKRDFVWRAGGKYHDPIALVSAATFGEINLSSSEMDFLFESLYEYQHENNPRFWSGIDLHTDLVNTTIDVFPEQRVAYIEKVIDVSCDCKEGWRTQQEAIYTFHLPEGGIGTSLSLWIDGREEKAALSTKGRTDSAYSSIVGRERRDPAIMKWQEGNRMVVNVFPVRHDLPRKFKVGFTVPIQTEQGISVLGDVYFQGPDISTGQENLRVEFHDGLSIEQIENSLNLSEKEGSFYKNGEINKPWVLSWKAPELSNESFCFSGNCYSLEPEQSHTIAFKPRQALMDINAFWTKDDFKKALEQCSELGTYIYNDQHHPKLINDQNWEQLFDRYSQRNFSIAAHMAVSNSGWAPEETLVITKSNNESPNLHSLDYNRRQRSSASNRESPFFLFELSRKLSTHSKVYAESGLANAHFGAVEQLGEYLSKGQFPKPYVSNTSVDIPEGEMRIAKTIQGPQTSDPSKHHLMRLFNYGQLMKDLRPHYFDRDRVQESQIELAQNAHIVSPYSSLISLETEKDYERFKIQKPTSKSLGNSNLFNQGAVPEPHEWALICLAIVFLSFMMYKRLFG